MLKAEILVERAKLDWANGQQEDAIRLLTHAVESELFSSGSEERTEDMSDMAEVNTLSHLLYTLTV
jgi:hypothetical protein